MKRTLVLSLSLILATFSLLANQTLVKGKVIDKIDNKPKEVELIFEDGSGKKIKVRSNKLTGEYQQLLEGGKKYEVTVVAGDVFRETFDLSARSSDSAFVEQNADLRVTTLNSGRELMSFGGFSGSSLSAEGQKELKGLNKMLRFNRGLTLDIVVADGAKKAQVVEATSQNKRIADRINVLVDPSAGNDIIYKVNKNELLFD